MNRIALLIPLLALAACATARGPASSLIGAAGEIPIMQMSIQDPAGPWVIHLVEIAPEACGLELRTVKAGGRLAGRAPTSQLARELAESTGRPVLAAVNGDFFAPDGAPTNAQISDGRVIRGPRTAVDPATGSWPVFGITRDGRPFIDVVRFTGRVWRDEKTSALATGVNTSPIGAGLTLYNPHVGAETPADSGVYELRLRALGDADRMHGRGVVLSGVDSAATGIPLGEGEVVLAGRGAAARFLAERVGMGDTLSWQLRTGPVARDVREMIGGSHRLVQGGRIAADIDSAAASFGPVRHPRTAVGWRADGALLLVAIDGRQPDHSVGVTLREAAQVMLDLELVEAINLDGGGSTTQLFYGNVVNRPSDAEGERAVGNALVVLGGGEGCP